MSAVNHVNTLARLPDNISFDESTIITTAGSSIYGIDEAGGYIVGETVVVLGPGPIGLTSVQICKALGAEKVILTGTREERLQLGKELGADHVVNTKKENAVQSVLELTHGKGADLVLEAAGGSDSLQQAIEMTRKGGRISIIAFYKGPVTADISVAVRNRINLYTTRGEGRLNVHRALSLMAQGKLNGKSLITHTFPLEDIKVAIDTFVERRDGAMKVVVHP
jgi:L-iditol 2-dehydrogenase